MSYPDVLTGKRVLICEDEAVTVMQLDRMLSRAGLVVVGKAYNGLDGLRMAQCYKPDLILMDIVMPTLNGLEATRRIMAKCPTCVVMFSAITDRGMIAEACSYGASGHVVKPVTTQMLLPALRCAMLQYYDRPLMPAHAMAMAAV